MKSGVFLIAKLLALTILYFILFGVISAALIPASTQAQNTGNESNMFFALLAVSILNTLVVAYVVLRSRLTGWKLALSLFVILFGVGTFMAQIETAVFVTGLPPGLLSRIVLSGFFMALTFSPLAVLVLGRGKSKQDSGDTPLQPLPVSQWIIRLTLIALCYVVIYFTFGYFLAWKNPAVRAYYHGTDPGGVVVDTPWLVALQFVRGLLWVFIALPVVRMMKGERWEIALAVAVCFAVFMSSLLLLPNPLMPTEVRMAHLVETATSNFLFGCLLVFVLLSRRHTELSTVKR
jgi:hypothetical protein